MSRIYKYPRPFQWSNKIVVYLCTSENAQQLYSKLYIKMKQYHTITYKSNITKVYKKYSF